MHVQDQAIHPIPKPDPRPKETNPSTTRPGFLLRFRPSRPEELTLQSLRVNSPPVKINPPSPAFVHPRINVVAKRGPEIIVPGLTLQIHIQVQLPNPQLQTLPLPIGL